MTFFEDPWTGPHKSSHLTPRRKVHRKGVIFRSFHGSPRCEGQTCAFSFLFSHARPWEGGNIWRLTYSWRRQDGCEQSWEHGLHQRLPVSSCAPLAVSSCRRLHFRRPLSSALCPGCACGCHILQSQAKESSCCVDGNSSFFLESQFLLGFICVLGCCRWAGCLIASNQRYKSVFLSFFFYNSLHSPPVLRISSVQMHFSWRMSFTLGIYPLYLCCGSPTYGNLGKSMPSPKSPMTTDAAKQSSRHYLQLIAPTTSSWIFYESLEQRGAVLPASLQTREKLIGGDERGCDRKFKNN